MGDFRIKSTPLLIFQWKVWTWPTTCHHHFHLVPTGQNWMEVCQCRLKTLVANYRHIDMICMGWRITMAISVVGIVSLDTILLLGLHVYFYIINFQIPRSLRHEVAGCIVMTAASNLLIPNKLSCVTFSFFFSFSNAKPIEPKGICSILQESPTLDYQLVIQIQYSLLPNFTFAPCL